MLKLRDEILKNETGDQRADVVDVLVEHVIALEVEVERLIIIVDRVERDQPHVIGLNTRCKISGL